MKKITTAIFFIMVFAIGVYAEEKLHQKLNGTWVNNFMTVKIDFDKETYSGIAMGEPFSNKLALIEEYANIVIFKIFKADTINTMNITCQIQDNGSIMLTKEGGIPLILEKYKGSNP